MRLWLADSLVTFRELHQARRTLLAETDGLSALPLRERLWHGHLFWIVKFAKIEALSAFRGITRVFIRRYCKTADRLFGGDRYQRYLEARRKEVEECKEKLRECEAVIQVLRCFLVKARCFSHATSPMKRRITTGDRCMSKTCLHCGRKLAFLKRTVDQFCSSEHAELYHQERVRLAAVQAIPELDCLFP